MRGATDRPALRRRPVARAFLVLAITTFAFLGGSPAAHAHPIGNFTINLYSGIRVLPGRVHIDYVLEMAEISTQEQKAGMDLDEDGEITEDEREGFADRTSTQIQTNLAVIANGQSVELRLVDSTLRFRTGQGGLDLLYMQATFEGELPDSGEVRYTDANFTTRPGWREIAVAAGPGMAIVASTVPDHTLSDELKAYPTELTSQPLNVRDAVFSFQPSDAPVEPTVPAGEGSSGSSSPAGSGGFADLLATSSSDRAIALLLVLAFGFGFLHALGPGHGKTIMAASTLSGSVRLRQALTLGGVVALMHCATVVGLGAIAYAASRTISSERVYSGLRLLTALVVLVVGAVMLVVRWRQRRAGDDDGHEHGGHRHPHPTPKPSPGSTGFDRAGIAAVAASGGLIPSPSAVVVLLGAIAVDRIPLGVALVVAFSIGLAASLVLVGVVSHYAKTRLGRTESRIGEWLPLAAAATIFVVGIVLTVQAAGSFEVLRG
jgi:nickel/cobalt transporter (NicO) family protein